MTAKYLMGLVALTAAVPSVASAQAVNAPPAGTALPPTEDFGRETITVGGGLVYLPDYEGSNDYQFLPAPAAIGTIKGIDFQVLGNRASADLVKTASGSTWDIQAGPVGVVNFLRSNRQGIDDPQVRRLGERGTAIELGGFVGLGKTGVITSPYDKLSFSLSYRHDVNGVHKSGILQPTINYFTPLSRKAAVGIFATAERVERDYVRTYYYVSPSASVNSGLPTYTNGRGGWKSWSLGAVGTMAITGDLLRGFKLVGGGTYSRVVGDVADSPLVSIAGSRGQWLGALGVAYTF